MKKKAFGLCMLAVVLIIVVLFLRNTPQQSIEQTTSVITVKNTSVMVEIADTDAERTLGLSGRDTLASDHGLLFVFPRDTRANFWMKDMKFAIDIMWVDSQKKIIHIEDSLQPSTYPKTFSPDADARYVLEVPAGFAKSHDILVGDTLTF
jgi:uncharacterized membrane protein (UPF0127 family)